jgi:subtilase family serine protease
MAMIDFVKASLVVKLLVKLSILALLGCGMTFCAFAQQASSPALVNHIAVCPGPAAAGHARCHLHVVVDEKGKPLATKTAVYGYGPLQFQTAYGVNGVAAQPTGQTIGIVDAYDDPNAESDLNTYSQHFGLPACTTANGCFTKVNQTGGTTYPSANQGWAFEISLDVQITHAMCPGCNILLVEANSNSFSDLLAAEDYATSNATVVSNSWLGNEFSTETIYDGHFRRSGLPSVPITFPAGDSGYGVYYPAASQYVTAVGGTTLTLKSNNTRASETAWSGTGSGCSAYEPKPTWQKDTGCARRTVADVSADANPNTGAAIYDSYGYSRSSGWFEVGGTSLSSQLIGSIYALAGNGTSTVYGSYPYANANDTPSTLYDVTKGSDGRCGHSYLCTAGKGYDGPTGLGTPDGTDAF